MTPEPYADAAALGCLRAFFWVAVVLGVATGLTVLLRLV